MKSANTKTPPKKRLSAGWWIVLAIVALVFAIGSVWLSDYHYDHEVDSQEDLKFARIETYVDLVKLRLDREIPEGKWYVEKTCDEPGTKVSTGEYSCKYGIKSNSTADIRARVITSVSALSIKKIDTGDNQTAYDFYPPLNNTACYFYYTQENSAWLTCSAKSHMPRYPLID